jgi:signal transduction histidine kinase
MINQQTRSCRRGSNLYMSRELNTLEAPTFQPGAPGVGNANEVLQECLDGLSSVFKLDDFIGQMMAGMTRKLGAVSATLRVRNFEQNTSPVEFVFLDGRVIASEESNPENWRAFPIDEQPFVLFLDQPTAVISTLDSHSLIPDGHRSYLLGLGVKTILIIPLVAGGQVRGWLTFHFAKKRGFHPEEIEIARALAIQAGFAIQLIQLGQAAKQTAVLEERNRLAGEMHDSLAQSFAGIAMQLMVAEAEMTGGEGAPLHRVRLAHEVAEFGLAEARRSALCLRSTFLEDSRLVEALKMLVERSNVAGRLRCDFHSNRVPEERLPAKTQHELLRIAQEAIGNAIRHGKPTLVTVTLRWESPNLVLQIKDNGSGIPNALRMKSAASGLRSMHERALRIDAKLDIQTRPGHGTSIIVTVPVLL